MIRLFLLAVVIFLLVVFIMQLKNYLARDKKAEQLRDIKLEGNLIDIDKEIAEEQARQKDISSKIREINSKHNTNKKEGKK